MGPLFRRYWVVKLPTGPSGVHVVAELLTQMYRVAFEPKPEISVTL
jgi:hypothetical protein